MLTLRHTVMERQSRDRPLRMLFVCVENSNRSQMAEAFARMHGRDLVEAFSAGSNPSGAINPKAIEAMRAVGYDLSTHTSKALFDLPNVEFDFVATMGCGDQCPMIRARLRVDWHIPDPKDLPDHEFHEVREIIENKVIATLRDLRVAGHRRWTS